MDNEEKLSITEMRKRKFAYQIGMDVSTDGKGAVADSYFKEYSAMKTLSRRRSMRNILLT
jgi:hypothetical protein